ncbi:ABC transporter permease [Diaminobutyricimonas sp. TR449]|uniref:ABC transporter permease n=1 Tax=Diaminobutyricimonas sp. TR449 TaxID=2708076 RepID=UPI00141F5287|nr:ABC transporter permease [Diaminobutyricimonas sp. TR449]
MAFGAFATEAPAAEPAPRKKSRIVLFLLLPGVLYLLVFFATPLVSLILTSLQAPSVIGDIGRYDYAFQWQNYVTVIETYWPQILRSFVYAALATLFALLFSYPLAYFIGVNLRRFPLLQALALTLVIAPFFISFLLRTLAWKQIFADEGWLVGTLQSFALLPSDAQVNGTPFAVIFGLTYNFIPFMTLPIYASLERLDLRYVEAGNDLYASSWTTFRTVTVPLSMPGILSGVLLTFIPAAGDFVNASRDFLGSTDTAMIGNVIEANFLVLQNYPAAAALSILLMAAILILVSFYVRRSGTEDLL